MQFPETFFSNSEAWHENRRTFIGGSDAAAVLGLSKWQTPYHLYLEKTGEIEPEAQTWEMSYGKALEPLLRQHYANTTGREVILPHKSIRSEKYPFMGYNPDGLIVSEKRLAEFKTAAYGDLWGEEGTDEIPIEYLLQVQHGLIVLEWDVAEVFASIGGRRPKMPYIVEADKELHEAMIESDHDFWHNHVLAKVPPQITTNADAAIRYRTVNSSPIDATKEIIELLDELNNTKQGQKHLEAEREMLEVKIKSFMGHNNVLKGPEGEILATWKSCKGSSLIDRDSLKKEMPEIEAKYSITGNPNRMFLTKQ